MHFNVILLSHVYLVGFEIIHLTELFIHSERTLK